MSKYSKFIVAAAVAVAQFIKTLTGVDLGINAEVVSTFLSALAAILVYAVPNKG